MFQSVYCSDASWVCVTETSSSADHCYLDKRRKIPRKYACPGRRQWNGTCVCLGFSFYAIKTEQLRENQARKKVKLMRFLGWLLDFEYPCQCCLCSTVNNCELVIDHTWQEALEFLLSNQWKSTAPYLCHPHPILFYSMRWHTFYPNILSIVCNVDAGKRWQYDVGVFLISLQKNPKKTKKKPNTKHGVNCI